MNAEEKLARTFLSAHPEVAAKLLEAMPAEQASEVLASAQPDVAGPVLHRMLPTASARCAEQLATDVIAALLEDMPIQAGAAMLRHLSEPAREEALGQLSAGRETAVRLLLHYPPNTVGAWMDTQILTLPDDCSVDEARVRAEEDDAMMPTIYVLDRNRHVRGAVSRSAIFREGERSHLVAIASAVDPIWARESVAQAQRRELWEHVSQAPVVNRHNEFVGVVTNADLQKGLRQTLTREPNEESNINNVSELYDLFVNGLEQSWQSINDILRGDDGKR
ncbi:MAG TPA: CBS domain-containing protein [Gammaproteobacteria bacterium]